MNKYRSMNFYKNSEKYKESLDDYIKIIHPIAFNMLAFINTKKDELYSNSKNREYLIKPYLYKLKNWEYENEQRLLIPDKGKDYAKIRYDFSALNSIIFGTNTSFEDKKSVINIIDNKMSHSKHEAFKFYEFDFEDDYSLENPIYEIQSPK